MTPVATGTLKGCHGEKCDSMAAPTQLVSMVIDVTLRTRPSRCLQSSVQRSKGGPGDEAIEKEVGHTALKTQGVKLTAHVLYSHSV